MRTTTTFITMHWNGTKRICKNDLGECRPRPSFSNWQLEAPSAQPMSLHRECQVWCQGVCAQHETSPGDNLATRSTPASKNYFGIFDFTINCFTLIITFHAGSNSSPPTLAPITGLNSQNISKLDPLLSVEHRQTSLSILPARRWSGRVGAASIHQENGNNKTVHSVRNRGDKTWTEAHHFWLPPDYPPRVNFGDKQCVKKIARHRPKSVKIHESWREWFALGQGDWCGSLFSWKCTCVSLGLLRQFARQRAPEDRWKSS